MHNTSTPRARRVAAAGALAAGFTLLLPGLARAQGLTVLPVNIEMPAGQMTTTMTVINNGTTETSVQIRALAWTQSDGNEQLTASDEVMASPPIATIAPGATQVVRLVLSKAPTGKEATYRLLLDQIPPVAAPGTVRLALRLSIPIFAQPETRALPHVVYHIESGGGTTTLVAVNDGARHDTVRDVKLVSPGGGTNTAAAGSPYVLSGSTRRWVIATSGRAPALGDSVQLTGLTDTGPLDVAVPVVARP
jgi:fimbrial chaperone protein